MRTPAQIEMMHEAGRRLARVLGRLKPEIKPGVSGLALDKLAARFIEEEDSVPAFLGYQPSGAKRAYPAVSCVSVNSIVVHGIPDESKIKKGDLVKIDLGLAYQGWYADAAYTVPVGQVSPRAERLIKCTEEALEDAIQAAKPGNTFGDIGAAVQSKVAEYGFSVVKSLTGHGIGRDLHEEPWVYNIGTPGKGDPLRAGMVLAIEPMVAIGKGDVRQLGNDSFATKDGSLSAHFEHTVAITEHGPEVLTKE
ncbi:MAG: type I methionyl aminopeptidase [Candidatus Liptonbacteria bacterium]